MNQSTCGNILVVDDESLVRDIVSRVLTRAGFSCAQASNVDLAWRHLTENEVDLITLDFNMPGRNGLELLCDIHATFPDIAVIMLTGNGGTSTAIDALTRGASAYLMKPIDHDELVFQVKRGLERRQLIIERREYTQHLEAKVQEQTVTIRRAHEETIHRLIGASMHRDKETGAHIKRVGLYSELMAGVLGWPSAELEAIRFAAPMHDIGKIGIPDAILQKPGKLTDEEYNTMKTHTTIGANMLVGSESPMLQMAKEIALAHHECWDGTGYPKGIAGNRIPESARIVAVVDVYDALSNDRVYRPSLPEDEVLGILHNGRGTHFDPMLLNLFLDLLPEVNQIRADHPDYWETKSEKITEHQLELMTNAEL